MLTIKNGYKKYDGREIFRNVNLNFEKNHTYGIIGVNGSGKTVLLKALAGYIKLTSGQIQQGERTIREKNNYLEKAGIFIGHPQFLAHLSLWDNLELIRKMCENHKGIDLEEWLAYFDLTHYKQHKFKNLSMGTKQKMGIIQAFMPSSEILILDEPFNPLDQESVNLTYQLIQKYQKNRIIILTSHVQNDIELLCDQIFRIENEQIIDDCSPH
ncbi:ABC-2 type transport system ATP-binding protein [Enterococcus sp. DIV2402]|uniref:ABC-2 type transport system ATP-binding protein n=1 Tax=Candidatus Enterococcus lowellii TaxID=2230877 RepID=A0ABZ2SKP7_9ENTE|nr:ABC transporter ATP-binding protein [Enterococcus sp. DIV2402]